MYNVVLILTTKIEIFLWAKWVKGLWIIPILDPLCLNESELPLGFWVLCQTRTYLRVIEVKAKGWGRVFSSRRSLNTWCNSNIWNNELEISWNSRMSQNYKFPKFLKSLKPRNSRQSLDLYSRIAPVPSTPIIRT